MNDTENIEQNGGNSQLLKLRPRRSTGGASSALADISNTFFQQLGGILPKKGSRKRKISVSQSMPRLGQI